MRKILKRTVASVATVAACVALTIQPGTAAAGPDPASHPKKCITFDNLTEISHLTLIDRGEPGEGVGDVVLFDTELYDSDGKLIGANEGSAPVYIDPATGRLKEFVSGIDTLPGGTVAVAGIIDLEEAVAGEKQTIAARGLTGRYQGKVGIRTFQLVERTAPDLSISESSISVCGRR